MLFDAGLSYSLINSALTALSSLSQISDSALSVGNMPLKERFMRGVYVQNDLDINLLD